MAGVTITSSPAVFWLACAQLRQIALRCYGRSLLSSRLATGRHLVVICDICHRMISCFIVCCLCCLSFLNASFFLNGFLDAAQLLFSGASYVIRIKWWQMHPEKNGSLWVVHHLRAVQGDISLPGTHVALRGPGHAKEHWMAKVASTGAQFRMGEGWRHFESLFLSYPNRSAG